MFALSDSKTRWIVSPLFDGVFFVCAPVFALIVYASYGVVYNSLAPSMSSRLVYIYFYIFTAIFDAPHIFQTLVRTHLDYREYQRHRILHWLSLTLAVGISFLFSYIHASEVFIVFLGFYGTWHILRQNVGFLHFYQKINSPYESKESKDEVRLFHWAFVLFYLFQTQAILENFTTSWLYQNEVLVFLRIIFGLFFFYLLFKVIKNNLCIYRFKKDWNLPKIIFIGVQLSFFLWLMSIKVEPLLLVILATVGHNIQYQAWMWWYQKKTKAVTWSPWVSLLMSLCAGIVVVFLGEPAFIIYNGLVFWHYFIDGKIWKTKEAPELKSLFQSSI